MRRSMLAAVAATALLAGGSVRADEISDAIGAAQQAYQAGKLQDTRAALQEAMQFLAQRAAASLGTALPDALPGWRADDVQTSAAGGAGMFGATSASRRYTNAQRRRVEIQLMSDNPMIAQMAVMLANPMLAGSMGRMVRVGEQRAIQQNDGDVQMLVDNRILVQVRGNASPEDKLAYASAIDVGKLTER